LVAVAFFQLYIPKQIGVITDLLVERETLFNQITAEIQTLMILGILLVLGRFVWRFFIIGASRRIEYHVRNDFFEHLETLSLTYFNANKTGDLMAHATNDMDAIRMMMAAGVMMMVDGVVLTTMAIVQMLTQINATLTLFAIIPMPFIGLFSMMIGKRVHGRFTERQAVYSELTDYVQENFSGIRIIKSFVQEVNQTIQFDKINQRNYQTNMKLVTLSASMRPVILTIAGLTTFIAIWVGGRYAMLGVISVGDFAAFIQYLAILIWPMIALGQCINVISRGFASLERINDVMDQQTDIADNESVNPDAVITGDITIRDLTFAYPQVTVPAVQQIDLTILRGQTIGITGRTGCGKTTLMNLLLHLYNPPVGSIEIGGQDIYSIPIKTLRKAIGYVPQDGFLFSDTIANNIAFGVKQVEGDVIEMAAKAADIHENIMDFPEQYQTLIGERGVTLSGGQKQRVAIARALIRDAEILILDDSVSAVDTKTEESILSHLKASRKGKTTIIIAHRISTISHADAIYVMDQGRIVERGTHATLLEQQGLYYDIARKQELEHDLEQE
jgi:ATP-binding cassette subfamily B protein